MMFWQYTSYTSLISQIDTLLDKEDVTLEEILDEDDVVQECKAHNKKLVDFLIIPVNLNQLVEYVVVDPPEYAQETVKYKYPNLACELLSSDVTDISEALTNDDTYLDQFYEFLSQDPPLNPLSASFYMKVMSFLVQKKGERVISYLKSKEEFLKRMVTHLGTSAVMDLLLRMIQMVDSKSQRQELSEWFSEEQLVHSIINDLAPKATEDLHSNASTCLSELIITCRDQLYRHGSLRPDCFSDEPEPDEVQDVLAVSVLDAIESPATVNVLMTNMFDSEEGIIESLILSGMAVLQTLLDKRKSESPLDPPLISQSEVELARLRRASTTVVEAVTPYVPRLMRLLVTPPPQRYSRMPTTMGVLDPPLGNTRLQVMRLFHSLITANNIPVLDELHKLNFCDTALNLFFTYNLNTFLHRTVTDIVCHLISTSHPQSDESVHEPLLEQLFKNCSMLEKILEVWAEADNEDARTRAQKRSYLGHLCRMANTLTDNLEFGNHKESVKKAFTSIDEETQRKWQEFVDGPLKDYNEKSTFDLSTLRSASVSDDGDDMLNLAFPTSLPLTSLQSAFSDYQSQQMTTEFIDERGFSEDTFADNLDKIESIFCEKIPIIDCEILTQEDTPNATMFEQACNEHMRQFDDPLEEELEDEDEEDEAQEELDDLEEKENGEESSPRPKFSSDRRVLRPNGGPVPRTGDDEDEEDDEEEDGWRERKLKVLPPTVGPGDRVTDQPGSSEEEEEDEAAPTKGDVPDDFNQFRRQILMSGANARDCSSSSSSDEEDLASPLVIRQVRGPNANAKNQRNTNAVPAARRVWEAPSETPALRLRNSDGEDDDEDEEDERAAVAERMARYSVEDRLPSGGSPPPGAESPRQSEPRGFGPGSLVLTSLTGSNDPESDDEEPATPRDLRNQQSTSQGNEESTTREEEEEKTDLPMKTPNNSPSATLSVDPASNSDPEDTSRHTLNGPLRKTDEDGSNSVRKAGSSVLLGQEPAILNAPVTSSSSSSANGPV